MSFSNDSEGFVNRIRWPDGPVCPYCGERERMIPEDRLAGGRVRYECVACERHRGYFRRPGGFSGGSGSNEPGDANGSPEDANGSGDSEASERPARGPIVPRFPT